jgi:hypothetical protein
MKVLQRNQCWQSLSSKKGAVIDIDIIVAYLLFISVIILLVNFSLRLSAPFSTSIESIEKEKNTLTLMNNLRTEFNINDLSELCNLDYPYLRRLSVAYEIKGFEMPATDSEYFTPNSINGSVVFRRKSDELIIYTGSQVSDKTIIVEAILESDASITNISLESDDYYTIEYDNFNNLLITLNSRVVNGDVDEIRLWPVKGVVSLKVQGVDYSNTYIGKLKASDYCGVRGIAGPQTRFNRYGLMTDGRNDYYVTLVGDVWWTS